jgi:bacteriorhodopsin
MGSTLALALVTPIQTSVDKKHPTKMHGYAGRSAAFWFTFALFAVELVAVLVFYHPEKRATPPPKEQMDDVEAEATVVQTEGDANHRETEPQLTDAEHDE